MLGRMRSGFRGREVYVERGVRAMPVREVVDGDEELLGDGVEVVVEEVVVVLESGVRAIPVNDGAVDAAAAAEELLGIVLGDGMTARR